MCQGARSRFLSLECEMRCLRRTTGMGLCLASITSVSAAELLKDIQLKEALSVLSPGLLSLPRLGPAAQLHFRLQAPALSHIRANQQGTTHASAVSRACKLASPCRFWGTGGIFVSFHM